LTKLKYRCIIIFVPARGAYIYIYSPTIVGVSLKAGGPFFVSAAFVGFKGLWGQLVDTPKISKNV